MGLPGFFAWILKQFSNEILVDKLEKKIKNLYIDANCAFHPECFKIVGKNQNDDLDELKKKMFKQIVDYLDFLEKYTNPTDIVYIAVDGTAPLAKIIQQRKRRYKTELDNFTKNELKLKYGIPIYDTWSNTTITPGTEFMEELHLYLLEHYEKKNKGNKKNKIKYIYSSYHTPGEGEHKILQHIKNNVKTDDNCVIYGLDADLIFLSMSAMTMNNKNIFLLREKSIFDKKEENDNNIEREMTFVSIKETKNAYNNKMCQLMNKYNIKNITFDFSNDLIFICFLLGNDFLPHFPSIDIHSGGLDELIDSYLNVLKYMNMPLINIEYINNKVKDININIEFFTSLIEDMGNKEENYFKNNLPNSLERHKKRKCIMDNNDLYKKELWELENLKKEETKDPLMLGIDSKDVWKFRYYEYYFKISGNQNKFIDELVHMYLMGIKWITEYYFKECPDWKWCYVCYYAPFISDIAKYIKKNNFDINNVVFDNDKKNYIPIMSQLISVLPPSCKKLLPKSYIELIDNFDKSPIIDMFPTKIQIDTLYKTQLYQCIPQIPYLDIDRILDATKNLKLDKSELLREKICQDFVL